MQRAAVVLIAIEIQQGTKQHLLADAKNFGRGFKVVSNPRATEHHLALRCRESSYIELVRWTGLQAFPYKRGKLSATEDIPQ